MIVPALLILAVLIWPERARAMQVPHVRAVDLSPSVPPSPIIGRATCGRTVWVLNRASQLIEIRPTSGSAIVHPVRGFQPGARPWALACVTDGTLWTLETPHVLAHLASDGRVVERVQLRLPRTALFAAGDRVVFHQLPTVSAVPLLASSLPQKPFEVRSFAGLMGRAAGTPRELFMVNLVNCGIAAGAFLPCWFADEARMTISDGVKTREVSIRTLPPAIADHAMPIWDAALVESGAVWALTSSAQTFDGRRAGASLVRVDGRGVERTRIDLSPPARLIVSATDATCTVLTTRGDLTEIVLK
jgi:hypothetical protein